MVANRPNAIDGVLQTTGSRPTIGSWPGLRTLGSPQFRIVLGLTLALTGALMLASLLASFAANPEGQYAFDFATYHQAARQVAAGQTPYESWMLNQPIPAQAEGSSVFKYPPVFAQVLVPLTALPLHAAAAAWVLLQVAAIVLAVWLAARAGGATPTVGTAVWCLVAAVYFLPNFDSVWKGNVSGVQALQVGLMASVGLVAGGAAATAALLKTTPAVLLLPTMLAGRRMALGMVATGLSILGASLFLSPQAWLDYMRVIPNLIAGPAHYAFNLAPDALVARVVTDGSPLVAVVRAGAVTGGAVALIMAAYLARRQADWPAALALAVAAMLLLPSSIWYHYLAVLLPIAALAWTRARTRARLGLVSAGMLISVAVVWYPLALVGAVMLVSVAVFVLWPRASDG